MQTPATFSPEQIAIVARGAALAEELVSNFYKMSTSQWLHRRYDIKTLADLVPAETVEGPFAQVIRYRAQRKDVSLGSAAYDFYKICLQDHAILSALSRSQDLKLLPFVLYIVTHELIHIVRFSKFIQNFEATPAQIMAEETRVHQLTHDILNHVRISGLPAVLQFYVLWRQPIDNLNIGVAPKKNQDTP